MTEFATHAKTCGPCRLGIKCMCLMGKSLLGVDWLKKSAPVPTGPAHYFEDRDPAIRAKDMKLGMAIQQGYVPRSCLLGGETVMAEITAGKNPCWGCAGPREFCKGKPRRDFPEEDPPVEDPAEEPEPEESPAEQAEETPETTEPLPGPGQ